MNMEPWYVDSLERWQLEQDALRQANISFQIDEEAMAHGFMRLKLQITNDSVIEGVPLKFLPLTLVAVFPSLYPYFRPVVYASEINLPRHQNIVDRNLCLLDRSTHNWLPQTTLASFLKEQLPKVLVEGEVTDPQAIMENPAEQAEPISEYYPNVVNASILFDAGVFDTAVSCDKKANFLGTINIGFPEGEQFPMRLAALEAFDKEKKSKGSLPAKLKEVFPLRTSAAVYRLQERPPHANADQDYKWFVETLKGQREKVFMSQEIKCKGGVTIDNIVGLSFPEEHSPGKSSWGWLFLINFTREVQQIVHNKPTKVRQRQFYYAKPNRISLQEFGLRITSLKPLNSKKIVVVGLGAIGAPAVIDFAKNGVGEIGIVDNDIVSAGTIVRWPLGVASAGLFKTEALTKFIDQNYPYTTIKSLVTTIGGVEFSATSLPPADYVKGKEQLEQFLSGVSLIFDTTAEIGVNHYLSQEAKKRGIPYVCAYGTPGVWGGAVVRVVPDGTNGCWYCFQQLLNDGIIPNPAINRNGNIQAVGCGDISFTGTSFELANISAAAVRMAVSTLCGGKEGYPDFDHDIGILSLVDDHGRPIFPKWTQHLLEKHINCPYCGNGTD